MIIPRIIKNLLIIMLLSVISTGCIVVNMETKPAASDTPYTEYNKAGEYSPKGTESESAPSQTAMLIPSEPITDTPPTEFTPESTSEGVPEGIMEPVAEGALPEYHAVIYDGILLGGSHNGSYLTPQDIAPKVKAGDRYKLYSSDGYICGGVGGGIPSDTGNIGPYTEMIEISPDNPKVMKETGIDSYLAISAEWDPQPRKAINWGDNSAVYWAIVGDILAEAGLSDVPPSIMQIYNVDIEGDGVDEVLIYAQNIVDPELSQWGEDSPVYNLAAPVTCSRNTYSLLFLRKIIDDTVHTIFIDKSIYLTDGQFEDGPPFLFQIQQFADVNGDGRLEIIIGERYYEGYGYNVYEVNGGKVDWVLGNGIGA